MINDSNKCSKCKGRGKIKVVPPPNIRAGLKAEIIQTYIGKEREAWLKTLEGVPMKCPDCKGTGRA
jgi:RecJ-like exonuclease